MELVDAHCHFDFPVFDDCRRELWTKARQQGVQRLVIPGVRRADWGRVVAVAQECADWYFCLGIHPWYIDEHSETDLDDLETLLCEQDAACACAGVGECGLDRLRGSLERQLPWFEAQVAIAGRRKLPLVIHSVRAHDEVAAVLRRLRPDTRVLVHGFSGSYQQARTLIDLGCYLGVGGVITHSRAARTRDAIARCPAGALVLETDAPDMAPAGVAKGRNEPACVRQVLTTLAGLKQTTPEDLAPVLLANVRTLYGWAD